MYTALQIRETIEADMTRLLASWVEGRPSTYSMDSTTKFTLATGFWLAEELAKICNDVDRRTQLWKFNRESRSFDIFETAATVMNEAVAGTVEQNRKPLRRWG